MLAPRDLASAQLLRHCLELALLLHAGQAVPKLLECAAGVLESCGDCCVGAGGGNG